MTKSKKVAQKSNKEPYLNQIAKGVIVGLGSSIIYNMIFGGVKK